VLGLVSVNKARI